MRADSDNLGELRNVRAVLFDMDGVLYVGNQPLPGVQEMVDYLDESGRPWLCVTNNASQTSEQFSAKLAGMGVRIAPERILGSAEATALWMAAQVHEHGASKGSVIVMGMEGLRSALVGNGFTVTHDPFAADYAVVGANFALTYADLADAALAIRNGARFIGTNPDLTFPSERGQIPGTGSLLTLFQAATSVKPTIIGKPFAPMFEQAFARLDVTPAETLMVGDRYDTDIAGAQDLGMRTVGVTTGVTTAEGFAAETRPPDWVLNGLTELLRLLRAADDITSA